ncbi:MAG: HU family DNA-binding protein [Planctomycetota bacterium]|nr:HU family DNA-binding protein [Planctomycetota bacterium]
MANIPKKVLIERLAEKTNTKRYVVRKVLQTFLDTLVEELANGNRFEFRDFGVFEVVHRKERIALNPKTLEKVKVPSKAVVQFKPGKAMRDSVNKAFDEGKLDEKEIR